VAARHALERDPVGREHARDEIRASGEDDTRPVEALERLDAGLLDDGDSRKIDPDLSPRTFRGGALLLEKRGRA
jgi:hypothetical protein